jgi:2-polyprenyl-3-methyl-5-hydroxy-6-metoxy-1,4-benzoquinol methylase
LPPDGYDRSRKSRAVAFAIGAGKGEGAVGSESRVRFGPYRNEEAFMPEISLTERQRREREYYEEYSTRTFPPEICFDPILGREKRPWNPYWFVCELVQNHFLSGEQKLLDFGSGTGEYSLLFAKIGYQVFGFDISPSNVSLAENLAQKYGLADKTHFSTSTAERLDYASEHFDVVVGIDILHHVDISRSVRECLRVLKPGGIAIFKEPVEVPVFDPLRNTKFGRWLVPKGKSYERHITEDERKLNTHDLDTIRELCPQLSMKRFRLFSRLKVFSKRVSKGNGPSSIERFDEKVFKLFPFMQRYGGDIVITLTKQ